MTDSKTRAALNATGDLRTRAEDWWAQKNMGGRITAIHVKGDGYIRFEWSGDGESGPYHLRLSDLYAADSKTPAAVEALRELKARLYLHRLRGPVSGNEDRNLLVRIEGDIEEWLNEHGFTRTPEYSEDAALAGESAEPVACPVCGNEERGQGGYLSCECPAPPDTALAEARAEIERTLNGIEYALTKNSFCDSEKINEALSLTRAALRARSEPKP